MKHKQVLAFYIRLSHEDLFKASGEVDESASVSHQRDLLHYTYSGRQDLSGYEVIEFVDDGYSGTNFNRPAFQKMMEEVKRGKIQCIMVKDFSRFARNFLDAGENLEQIFPFLGVRFISVNDHYDSDTKEGTAGDWDVVFKNFLYDLYSKDLSKKTIAAKKSKARRGEYLGKAPIGYVRSKEKENQLEIEPEGAKIVRFIFDMALSGHTIPEIVKRLNQAEIPTPGTLTEKVYRGKQMMVRKNTAVICWQYSMVWGILKNRVYTGACVNFKRSKTAPCGVHTKKNAEEEQIIVPGCHEAIVTEEEFVQAFGRCRIMKGKRNKKNNRYRPRRTVLSGVCVCGYCNRVMRYEYRVTLPDIFLCPTTRHADVQVDENICDCREYEVEKINTAVLKAVKQIGELAEKKYCTAKRDNSQQRENATKLERKISQLRQRVTQKKIEKQDCYELYIMEEVDRSKYLAVKQACDAEIEAAEKEITVLSKEMAMQAEADDEQLKEIENISLFANEPALTKEMVEVMIKEVRVYRDDRYEIKWKFRDMFDEMACP